ncbi:hypothetical protein BaRGS_00007102 [Batillaria attramentaria]|uniref:Uncharacterized protein n=1 Tax=Batillaria attramentaria TaxID=370345 RepID=A0ABD0LQD3_9CAEN
MMAGGEIIPTAGVPARRFSPLGTMYLANLSHERLQQRCSQPLFPVLSKRCAGPRFSSDWEQPSLDLSEETEAQISLSPHSCRPDI